MTPASPQAGAPFFRSASLRSPNSGATSGKAPSGDWASSTSTIHFSKKAATSTLKEAVRTKTCASPIHPRRSSRCGQSVGTLAPEDVLLELVDHLVRALEGPSRWRGRVDDAARDGP